MATDESDIPDPDIDELDATDVADQRIQDLADDRAWVETCLSVLREVVKPPESELVGRAMELVAFATCDRLQRLLRSDLESDR